MKQYVIKWLETQNRWQCNAARESGERKTFTSSEPGRKGKAIVTKKVHDWMEDDFVEQNIKVENLHKRWVEELKLTSSTSKISLAKSLFKNHIIPEIGTKKVSALSEQDLQNVINEAYKRGMGRVTLANIRVYLSLFIKYARKNKITKLVPIDVEIPKEAIRNEKQVLQPADIKKLFTPSENRYIHAFRFQFLLGLRPGELIGLTWDCISGDTLTIKQSINIFNETTSGKNKNAHRSIMLPKLAKDELKAQEEMLRAENIVHGLAEAKQKVKVSLFIFPSRDGEHIRAKSYYYHWSEYAAKNKIKATAPYSLRHTFISINKSTPLALLKQVVGHSDAMDTIGTYSHQQDGDLEQIKILVDSLIDEILN